MTTPYNEVPVSVDYTSRDYYSIRDELISRVQNSLNVPGSGVNWTGTDPSDFAVVLLEAFAYMGDSLNYYIDRIANESYIGTATQRQSIINLAKSYGYTPSGYRNSTTNVVFYNESDVDVVVPAGTQVSGEVIYSDVVEELIFTTDVDIVSPAAIDGIPGESDPVNAVHGELASTRSNNDPIYGEAVGVSTGSPNQSFVLSENQVVESSITVNVQIGDSGIYNLWRSVVHLADAKPTDAVYTIDTDADNFVYINFGDGISGAIPTNGADIKVDYFIGGGQKGNIAAGIIDTIYRTSTGYDLSSLTVSNTSIGSGGADPEGNDNIRINAPKALSALNRAVTLSDYANIALSVNNVGKANAVAATRNSVTLYTSPQQTSASTDLYPGYTDDPTNGGVLTTDWTTMKEDVATYLSDKTQIGVSVTIAPSTYVPVNLLAYFSKLPQYTDEQVKANIMLTLVNEFSYSYLLFEDIITPEEIEFRLRQVEGVYSIRVIALYKTGQTGRNTLLGGPGEIFVFDEGNLDIQASSTDAKLSSLVSSEGVLTPAFTADLFNYNLPIDSGVTSLTLTPTNSTASISVNGVTIASGSPATVTTPVGITSVVILVTAQDTITTQTYRVTISR